MMINSIGAVNFKAPSYAHATMEGRQKEISYLGEKKMSTPPLDTLRAYAMPFTGNAFEQKISPAASMPAKAFKDAVHKYTPNMERVIMDFTARTGKAGQFLNWVGLPAEQLKRLDDVYAQAADLKSRGKTETGAPRTLVVLGIGGSKHTGEFLLNMAGAGKTEKDGKVLFYADIEGISFDNFMKEAGGKIEDMNFLVVSKSGTTFETKEGYMRFKGALKAHYLMNNKMNEEAAEISAQKHFGFVTDKTGTPKNLRGEIGDRNGEGNEGVKELYVHDDVGGRFSMFDDAGIFELAYAGVDKNYTERILKAADAESKRAMSAGNLESNAAANAAMFNVFARETGRPLIQQQLFGKVFEGGGENWSKQLYLESLKDFNYGVGGAPASMHYASEGHFSPANKGKYSTILTMMDDVSQNYKKYTGAIEYAYNTNDVDENGKSKGADTAVMVEKLATEGGRIKPEAIGEYIQAKHFETVYMGMLRRAVESGETIPQTEALPEVLQPSVEVYKNNFKPGSEFELTPGSLE